jgi:hypothetical protein
VCSGSVNSECFSKGDDSLDGTRARSSATLSDMNLEQERMDPLEHDKVVFDVTVSDPRTKRVDGFLSNVKLC